MIPREILKRVRQIDLRTKLFGSDTSASRSFQTASEFGGVSLAVPHGNDFDFAMLLVNGKINRVRPAQPARPTALSTNLGKPQGPGRNSRHYLVNLTHEANSQSFGLFLIPGNGLLKFGFGFSLLD